jgi:hypothetical protein
MLTPLRACLLAVVGVLALAAPVSADSTTGQTGNYLFTDSMSTPGVRCYYVEESGIAYIHQFTAKPPSLWWPDTNSSINTQHGKVGWRFIVQQNQSGNWVQVKKSAIQKATAYEDSQNPYGAGTKAPLTKMSLTLNAHNFEFGGFRVLVKAFWYRHNGSVMGTASHVVDWYKYAGTSTQTVEGFCAHSG